MALIYYGIDNEFAVATGSNVGTSPNRSRFDNPPQGSKDLVITVQDGDDDPRLFEIGDTYDVSWGGQGGGGTILNAVVVRSDAAPGGGGVIVLEGTDENGDPAQVIWTPGFDLEGWYADNFNPSNEPEFFTSDQDPAYTHTFVCFAARTLIETVAGVKPVETLVPGDLVMTLDAGPQPLLWVGRRDCVGFRADTPVRFEKGAIGNARPLVVSQQHRIMIRSPRLELYFTSHEVLAPAKAFLGLDGVRLKPQPIVTYVHVLLGAHHVVRADGVYCETLFLGDAATKRLQSDPGFARTVVKAGLHHRDNHTARPALRMKEAVRFLKMHGGDCAFGPTPTLENGLDTPNKQPSLLGHSLPRHPRTGTTCG